MKKIAYRNFKPNKNEHMQQLSFNFDKFKGQEKDSKN